MICQCKPPKDGGLGCGPRCLNRLLNMECTPVRPLFRFCIRMEVLVAASAPQDPVAELSASHWCQFA